MGLSLGGAIGAINPVAALGTAASIGGDLLNAKAQTDANKANIQQQRDFARHGIQWRVQDAKSAGVHPLYALGAQTPSFSPSSQPVSYGDSLSRMGQDISRAAMSSQSADEKKQFQIQQSQQSRLLEGQIQNQDLRNQILQEEFNALKSPGTGPGIPSSGGPGTFATNDIKKVPAEVTSSLLGGFTQAGHNPMFQLFKSGPDSYKLAPSAKYKEAIEDSPQEMFSTVEMLVRNGSIQPYPPKSGYHWAVDKYLNLYQKQNYDKNAMERKHPSAFPSSSNRNLKPLR
ncbi:MAG: DNA pilot protein [Microviridae sp.]|nr:MAG: DNA pilot protein [Microviridae sp.]